MQDEFIAYSDNIDTQILQFNQTTLQIVKLTKKISVKNGLERLEAAKWMKIVESDSHDDQKTFELIMITQDLKVLSINLSSLEITQVQDLNEIISSKLNTQETKFRTYDQIFIIVDLTGRMMTINFMN